MIGSIGASLQLQPIITAHNRRLSKTRSIPYWTTSVFSSAVTDLVPIYESVTSWASVVRCLTLHTWTLNSWTAFWILLLLTNAERRLKSELNSRIRVRVRVRVTLLLAVYPQSVRLGARPLETHDQYFFQLNTCDYSIYVTFSLTRGWVCRLQLLLVLASAVILMSESRGTHGHILLSQIRDFLFRRLLRLAGLRWRYSTPPPHGLFSNMVKFTVKIAC
jgi:hypothetical protein